MPASFIECGGFGIGISFPRYPCPDDRTKKILKEYGFKKRLGTTHYTIEDTPIHRVVTKDIIEVYNLRIYGRAA